MSWPKTASLIPAHSAASPFRDELETSKPIRRYARRTNKVGDTEIVDNLGNHHHNVLIGIPTLGIIRIEVDIHRRGQTVPINWQSGEITVTTLGDSIVAQGYTTPDAQNLIAQKAIDGKYNYVLYYEDDMLPPFDSFVRLSEHIEEGEVPIISGLYFSKGSPSWPLVFRGRGNACYRNWALGDRVWCDGVPTGFLLIHTSVLFHVWKQSQEYRLPDGQKVRKVFEHPRSSWFDPETDSYYAKMGTCVTPDVEVLTKEGFKVITEISPLDEVVGLNQKNKKAEYVSGCKLIQYEHKGRMIHFEGNCTDLIVNDQHKMWCAKRFQDIREWKVSDFKLERADSLVDKNPYNVLFSSHLDIEQSGSSTFSIPRVESPARNNRNHTEFPIVPFSAFMGWYLSEGCVWIADPSKPKQHGNKIQIAKCDPVAQLEVAKIIRELGFNPYIGKDRVRFSAHSLSRWLQKFGKAHEKYISRELLLAPRKALEAMFNALVSCDGQIIKTNRGTRYEYHTVSPRFANDFQELALRLGYRTSITTRNVKGKTSIINGKLVHHRHDVHVVRASRNRPMSSRQFRIVEEYKGMLFSLAMPKHHVYMARRNGKCMWTGNSDLAFCDYVMQNDILRKAGWKKVADKRYPFLVDTRILCGHITLDGKTYPQDAAVIFGPLRDPKPIPASVPNSSPSSSKSPSRRSRRPRQKSS